MPDPPHLLGPWRRLCQWAAAGLATGLPFIRFQGVSLIRFDLPGLSMELAGHRFRIEDLYLLWLGLLFTIFLFILQAVVLGRVWCGWSCPQTALCDLADGLEAKKWPRPLRHLSHLLISLWAGIIFVWYFISPYEFVERLSHGSLGFWPSLTVLGVALLTMADLSFVRRLFCRAFCPYGRLQAIVSDRGTLTLQADPRQLVTNHGRAANPTHPQHGKRPQGGQDARKRPASYTPVCEQASDKADCPPCDRLRQLGRCLDCKACLRVCPTAIDIRQGFQIECINCARCLDACRTVMARRGEEGIIRYFFGTEGLGWRAALTPKTVGLGLLVLCLGASTLFLASHRPSANFTIGRALLASRVTEDGRQQTFFNGAIVNRRQTPQRFTLSVRSPEGEQLMIKGPSDFTLAGNEKRDLTLAVDSPMVEGPPAPITFRLQAAEGGSLIEIDSFLTQTDHTPTRRRP